MEGWLVWLPYISVEVVVVDKVLDLVLQVVAFLSIMPIVAVEAIIMLVVSVLGSRPHCEGSLHKRPKKAGRLDPNHESLDDHDGCASGMALTSSVKWVRYCPRCSSSFYLISRRDTTVGFGWALERKLPSNSLTS
ncbi:hypothetical protein B296_00039448 [Ensete ventricosum]|uniref:Uncharacterized protein n=1 Tax=Ensete ventricosum TaxID=4639 RepID=A0A426X710_ENSVE|nr:hypothetical protein B296_00039448 [Ensete ventricosum]